VVFNHVAHFIGKETHFHVRRQWRFPHHAARCVHFNGGIWRCLTVFTRIYHGKHFSGTVAPLKGPTHASRESAAMIHFHLAAALFVVYSGSF
jgi:cytochrome b561